MTECEKQQKFMREYGHVTVRLIGYYKYSFTFTGEQDGNIFVVEVGGCASDIYRFEILSYQDYTINELQPYAGKVSSLDGEILSFYNLGE